MLKSFIKWPQLVLSAVYEKIAEQAKKANTSVKNFLGDDTNIDHISLVVYDVLPLAIKLGLRFDKFNKNFHEHFKTFRDKIYSYEESMKKENSEVKDMEETQSAFKSRLEDFENSIEAFNSQNYPNGISPKEVHDKLNEMMDQAQQEKAFKEMCQQRFENLEGTEIFNSVDYPNGISKEEVLAKIEAMVSNAKDDGTRLKMLKDWQEAQKNFKELSKSINNPKQSFATSNLSKEEIRAKFINMVSEGRENKPKANTRKTRKATK